jgi:hypothetical protein
LVGWFVGWFVGWLVRWFVGSCVAFWMVRLMGCVVFSSAVVCVRVYAVVG